MLMAASLGTDFFQAFLQGAAPGAVYALVAVGFVLTYKTSGVFNLAFGAQAYVSAATFFTAKESWGWETLPAFIVSVLVIAPLLGLVLERLIFRYLRTAGAVPKLVVTIGLSVAIPALFDLILGFKAVAGKTPQGIMPDGANVFYDPFGVYAFSRNELAAMAIVLVATLGLGAMFKFSAMGLQMQAVVESPRMTELNGIAADRVSAFAWMLSSLFAGLAGVLIAPRFNTLVAPDYFNLVVVAIAAAAIGKLVSLPKALLGGLGLGVLIAMLNTFMPRWVETFPWLDPIQDNVTPAIPFIVLFAVLVFVPSIRRATDAGDPLADVDPPAQSLGAVVKDRRATIITSVVWIGVIVAVGGVVFSKGDQRWLFLVTQAVVFAIIFLSITVMTGMAGQISLCQGAFAAVGAFTVFQLVERYNVPVTGAAIIGGLVAAAVGALLSLPIRRLGGIWIAIATLAFAYFFDAVLVRLPFVGGGEKALLAGTDVPRPVIGPWDLENDKLFLALCIVVLVVVALAVRQIQGGTLGRVLVALRGSEVGAASIGISSARARLMAFAISAFVAGLGGALLAMLQGDVNYGASFSPFAALFWIVIVVTIGSRSVQGAIVAGAAFTLFDAVILKGAFLEWILRDKDLVPGFFPISPKWLLILFGLGTIQYARHPEGALENRRRRIAARRAKRESEAGPVVEAPEALEPAPISEPEAVT
jgi:branched-subunit amino acid ABC-type transport system permease component